jgi:DUF4097 and DUF4098 domain-containing protein YvlB
MRNTAVAMLLFTLAAGSAAAQGKETETVDRTIAFSRGGSLKLKNFSGDVHVTGTAGNDVVVHAVRTATRDRLDNIKLDIEVSGSTVSIEANRRAANWGDRENNVVETQFEIQVPAATSLNLYAFSGDLIVRGTTAEIAAQTFSGNIDLDVSTAPVSPDVKAETFSGDITTRVPAASNGRVEFNSFSGDLRSDLPLLLHRKSRRDVSADLGTGGGATLEFKTFSGDLRLVK